MLDSTANLKLPRINLGIYLGHGASMGKIHLDQTYLDNPLIDLPLLADINASKVKYTLHFSTQPASKT